MHADERDAVDAFITAVQALVTNEAIRETTRAFISNKSTTLDMLQEAYRTCESLVKTRRQVFLQKENVTYLAQRRYLHVACDMLRREIDMLTSDGFQYPFGIMPDDFSSQEAGTHLLTEGDQLCFD